MISASVTTVFLFVAALTLDRDVSCSSTSLNSLENIGKSNRSVANDDSDVEDFPVPTDDELDTERIFGGRYARQNQFPFMVAVHRLLGRGMVSQCGGTIITPRWVLTAGHCVAYPSRQFLVVFGVNDKTGMGYNFYKGPGVSMMTNKAYLHSAFKPTINDIGLLHMPRNIPFAENIQSIQLAGSSYIEDSFVNRMGIVIGWGKDRFVGTGTKRLKYATLPIISNSRCSLFWGITKKHVCTAANYGQDACQGDSGGPLIVVENGVPLQIGIVSYGDANCPSNRPGVFSRITGYIDWIRSVTEIVEKCRDIEQFSMHFLLVSVFLLLRYGACEKILEKNPLDVSSVNEDAQANVVESTFSTDPYDTEKIAGGYYAEDEQFPFMAVVHRLLGHGAISQCGGTVISRRWVLTAGHCVASLPHKFLVVFGIIDKAGIGYNFNYGPGVSMIATRAVTHPRYRQSTNDIGLIYMPQNIPFTQKIQPIRLASYDEEGESFANLNAYVVGWGKDRQNSFGTRVLKYAVLPIISNGECNQFWRIDDRNICTANDFGQNACQGDSGGPLLVTMNNRPLQVGIVSYGDGMCPSERPAVFTRVSTFISWIEHVTRIYY
nr:PREDICTED: transmembrane protease serine 11D-like [Megachile rotundata]